MGAAGSENLRWVPLVLPLVVLQLGLMIYALHDLRSRRRTRGPKWVWALVVVLVHVLGPLVYLFVGREED